MTPHPKAIPLPVHRPFAGLSDDQLLVVGVPWDWLEAVPKAEDASVERLFDRLPGEAAEPLLDFLTGGNPEDYAAERAEAGADPFATLMLSAGSCKLTGGRAEGSAQCAICVIGGVPSPRAAGLGEAGMERPGAEVTALASWNANRYA
jgi:hypothetical protein